MRLFDVVGAKSGGIAVAALCVALLGASPVMAQHGQAGGAAVTSGGGGGGSGGGGSGGRSAGGFSSSSGGLSSGRASGSVQSSSGGRSFSGRTSSSGRVYGHNRGRRFHRHGRNGVAFGYFDDDYGYVGSCDYYRRRALVTGSRYWWRRYHHCVGDY